MDIQIETELFKKFLKRCNLNKLVNDLVIHASNGQLFALFCNESQLYCEVYETKLKIFKEGNIRVPELKKLINIINRAESKIIKIVSTDELFVITDGNAVGKFKAEIYQTSEADTVASYEAIEQNGRRFDKNDFTYTRKKLQFKEAVEINIGSLNTLLKDAQAFACESYDFNIHESKKLGKFLRCTIENGNTGEKFHRTVASKAYKCDIGDLPRAVFGNAFREIVQAISGEKSYGKEDKNLLNSCFLYLIEEAMLITDGKSYFYVLSSVEI